MLLAGVNHVAIITEDTERLCRFYEEVFGATVVRQIPDDGGVRLTFVQVGPHTELNVFEVGGPIDTPVRTPMFGRGVVDHFGLQAASKESFDEIRRRLMDRGASDGFVTDFGPLLSVFFRDPDGLEAEVCVDNPDAVPGVINPPGTPAAGYDTAA